jgi:hypothetical protein
MYFLVLTCILSPAMIDMDGNAFEIPPWTTASEGAATVITGMLDPAISSKYTTARNSTSKHFTNTILGFNGSYLNQNAVSDHELHTHINDTTNWARLWELSENLTSEKFTL